MIIYEDENILAVNKPAGFLVHPAREGISKPPTLVDRLIKNYPEIKNVGEDQMRPGIVHRLDKDTSGILIIAKNQSAFEFLKKQFQERKIKKTYIALVKGRVKNKKGIIDSPVKRYAKTRDALTEYKVLKRFQNYTLLEVLPKTGRTHQIRIHLKTIKHPVVCDKLYTKKPDCPFDLKRHFLHALSLELTLPNGSRIKLEAGLPEDLQLILNLLQECDKDK
jgi:23S rRNA pseudouridine1911/1915/1917 synthase